jgi:ribonuclease PH
VQSTAEGEPFSRQQLDAIIDLAETGIGELFASQRDALTAWREQAR